jgi:pantoate--beta-alanine ligase
MSIFLEPAPLTGPAILSTGWPVLAHTPVALSAALPARPAGGRAVVMTMGALHAGHASLMREARKSSEQVVVTVFVNPLQFGPGEDLDRYPRTLPADMEVCAAEGVDAVFAPSAEVMYPDGPPCVRVDPGPLGDLLEGESRPGHFVGVLTVVLKLLMITRADRAYFGEKDFQQLALIRQMVRDLQLPVEIIGVPTVREGDGLARSSRNRYLDPAQRTVAPTLAAALAAGVAAGTDGTPAVLAAVRGVLESQPLITLDRLDLVDPITLRPATSGPARLLIAARLGTTRLIDNIAVALPAPVLDEEV